MRQASDPRFEHCPKIDAKVSVCQSPGECRARHGCGGATCSLEGEIGIEAFDARLRAFSATHDLWPLGGASAKGGHRAV